MRLRLALPLVTALVALAAPALADPADAAPRSARMTSASTLPLGGMVFDSARSGPNLELYAASTPDGAVRRLTSDPAYDSWGGRLSPDRRTVVFQRTPAGVRDGDYRQASIWTVGVDGRNLTQVRPRGRDGWALQGHPEWAPDNRSLVVFGGALHSPQIALIDRSGAVLRWLTARGGTNLDPSFAPDGRTVVFVGCPQATCYPSDYEVYTVPVAGGAPQRVTYDTLRDHDPVYSPDGSRLAWLSQFADRIWDVRIARHDGAGARRLMADDAVTSRPEWARDGQRLYFHRLAPGVDRTFTLYSAKTDGSDLRRVRPTDTALSQYPST